MFLAGKETKDGKWSQTGHDYFLLKPLWSAVKISNYFYCWNVFVNCLSMKLV